MTEDVFRRRLVSAALSLEVMASLGFFSWPGLNPDLWEDLSVAVGLRPSVLALAGTWRYVLSELFGWLSFAEASLVLRLLGIVGGGIVTFLVYGILDSLLPAVVRKCRTGGVRGGLVVDGVLSGVTLLFVCSEPVWRSCQGAGSTLVQLLLALLAIRLLLDFLFHDGVWRAILSVSLAGFLGGYGNFGLLLFPTLWVATLLKSLRNRDNKINPLADPIVRNRLLSLLTFLFLALTAVMMYADYCLYYRFGGVERSDFVLTDLAIVVLGDYYRMFLSQTSGFGVVLAFIFFLAPFVISYFSLPKVLVVDRLQAWPSAVALFVMGVVAWSQISCFRFLWARQWFLWTDISDGFTVAVLSLFSAVTLVWTYSTLLYNQNFHSLHRVAGYQYGDESETPVAKRAVRALVRFNRSLGFAMVVFALLAILGSVAMLRQTTLIRMLKVIDDYCREVACECGEATRLITDGSLDAGVELAAFSEGHRLVTLSLLSGSGLRDVKLRQRDVEDEAELAELERSTAAGLWHWLTERTNRLDQVALQCGFERRQRLFGVKGAWVSGLLARLGGRPLADGRPDLVEARRLMREVVDICETDDPENVGNRQVLQLFRFVQWRLAQMGRVRNAVAGDDVWTDHDSLDERLASRLDELNPSLQMLKQRVQVLENDGGSFLSPREGLILGLQRADFTLARNFAQTVIRRDPGDAQAHFAIGMYNLMAENYQVAIEHLQLVLKRLPEDPVALNNLALCYDRLKCPEKALAYAERALKAAPKNQSIRENVERYRQANANGGKTE